MTRTISHDREEASCLKVDFSGVRLNDEQFEQLCRDNRDLRIELTSTGELIVMPPAGSKTGARNFIITGELRKWVEETGNGIGFDSSAGFTLPNGAKRAPDCSWLRSERWQALTQKQQESFAPVCPDFVIELRSPTDVLSEVRAKMVEYMTNGAQLGWLIDPLERRVYLYRPGEDAAEVRDDPEFLEGDPVLPRFILRVRELW